MHILLVTSTTLEENALKEAFQSKPLTSGLTFEFLRTGVGIPLMMYYLTKKLQHHPCDLVINTGIAGSYRADLPLESIVNVRDEVFGDWGISEKDSFRDIFEMGLVPANDSPFSSGKLINPIPCPFPVFNELELISGITVNQIETQPEKITRLAAKYNASIESMEGAAVFTCCLLEKVSFLEIRAISNIAGERNKNNWKINESLSALTSFFKKFIQSIPA